MFIKEQILNNGWGPGGWTFLQPETNWTAPHPLGTTFKQQVENIRQHRLANPRFGFATDSVSIARELEEYTLARWRKLYSEHGMQKFLENPDADLKKKHNSEWLSTSKQPPSLLAKVAVRAGIGDTSVLEDWFGAGGKAVSIAQSTHRAMVCENCPGNRKGAWRDALTIAGAKMLRAYFSAKNDMQLSTAVDKNLGLCKACGCVLELKVWTPISWVLKNLDAEQKAKLTELNPNCWITSEAS